VILAGDELIVIDLKYGRGVHVDAEDNPQLQIYALAALREFDVVGDFETVRMVIHQPRLNSVSEWVQTVDALNAFGEQVTQRAAVVSQAQASAQGDNWHAMFLAPGDKQCKFCSAKADCPAIRAEVLSVMFAEPVPETPQELEAAAELVPAAAATDAWLSACMAKADLIETWVKAIRGEVEARLLAGKAIAGFKLVQGKKGNRAWTSKDEAEAALKAMRIKHDQMYDYSVISPTSAEKLVKAEVIGPRQWPKLQALITQSDGKPSVAPESDKRPALQIAAVADEFTEETATSDLA
jgi:hypothetical protein